MNNHYKPIAGEEIYSPIRRQKSNMKDAVIAGFISGVIIVAGYVIYFDHFILPTLIN